MHSFVRGVTVVRNFVVFNFCSECWRNRHDEAEALMTATAGARKREAGV